MLTDCSDPKEVSEFHFLQLRTLRIAKENECIPVKSINIVASASKYGLLFVGIEGGFKVLKLDNILTLDEDKDNRSIEENYPFFFVQCETPVVLSVNASQTTLAVCTKNVLNLYSLSALQVSSNTSWQPFCSNSLLPPNTELREFAWNPTLECLYAFCMSDGSLHIQEVSGTSFKNTASLPAANVLSVCWSPKGKQLVAGKQDGCFSQYKPNLEVVNTVKPPLLEEGPIFVTSICWISNTVFAVVYVTGDAPNLFIVSTPKGAAVNYMNFNDVCLGNNSILYQRYLLHLEIPWGILICASLDSIEVAVLGDMPNWVQWDIKEDGKALLPGKDGATHAVGMAVMYSAQRQIVVSENESYPPMPVMFLLTNNGLLVSFHMINAKPEAPNLVSPPLETNIDKGLILTDAAQNREGPFISSNQSLPSSFAVANSTVNSQAPISGCQEVQNVMYRMEANSAFSFPGGQKETSVIPGNQAFIKASNKPETAVLNLISEGQDKSQVKTSPVLFSTEKQNEVQSSTAGSSYIMTAILSEIQSFMKELQDLKQLQSSAPGISSEEDMISLKMFALNLHSFQKDITAAMQSISSDIYTLKNVLLESFVMVEEACSRERRRNDHSYITMLKERALDPMTAKQMQKMNQHYQYLSTQLQEVSDKLDQEWIHLMSDKKKSLRNNHCISSTEAIYKTIVNNQKIIHNLKKKVDLLQKKAEEKKLRNITKSGTWGNYHKRSMQEDLSKLADEFLQVKIRYPEEREPAATKKLSQESQNFLKTFLKESSIMTVRPTTVYSPSQSRLLSNAVPSNEPDQVQDDSLKQVSTRAPFGNDITEKASTSIKTPGTSSKLTFPVQNSSNGSIVQPYAPVCEPVTPPDVGTYHQSSNKTFTSSTLLKEKYPEHATDELMTSSAANVVCVPLVTPNDTANQVAIPTLLNNVTSNKDRFASISAPAGTVFSKASSETIPVASSSFVFPKTLILTSEVQKSSESAIPKPDSTSVTLPVSSFHFDQRKDALWSASTTISSTTSSTLMSEPKSSASMEKSQQDHKEVPLEPLSNTAFSTHSSHSGSFTLPVTKISQASAPLIASSMNKNSQYLAGEDTSKSAIGSFSQKSSDSTEQTTLLKKDNNVVNSSFSSSESPSFTLNLVNKSVLIDSKSPSSEELSTALTEVTSKSTDLSISNQALPSVIPRTDSFVTANSQPDANKFSGLPDLKQSFSSPNIVVPKTKVAPSVSVIESVASTLPQLTSPVTVIASPGTVVTSPVTVVTSPVTVVTSPVTVVTSPVTVVTSPVTVVTSPATVVTSPATVVTSPVTVVTNPVTVVTNPSVTSTIVISQPNLTVSESVSSTLQALSSQTATSETLFGQSAIAPSPDTSGSKSDSSAAPSFGMKSVQLFGQPASEAPSFFSGVKTDAPVFGQTSLTQSTPFGQPTSTSGFPPPSSGGFFSQTATFGSPDITTTTNSDFNNQSSTFSFGKPAFGQATGSFGLAKSFFGQNTSTPFTQQSASPSSFSFSQNSGSVFGQGSFFSGLGGKPSEENASKNVFGISSGVKSPDTGNLFRNSSVSSFGNVGSSSFSGTGSFSGGGGSVAQSGFGSFQPNASQQPGGFGGAPAFGGPPAFGSPPAFGTTVSFGSGNTLSPGFGQQPVSSNFSNFANASSPTFGSLASQGSGFGSPQVTGFGATQGNTFGSPPAFGGSSFGGQSSSFGSPGSPPSNSSAFSQWRN